MDSNYVIVYKWMIDLNEILGFTQKELLTLAFVFGITSNGKNTFNGKPSVYICRLVDIDVFKFNEIISNFKRFNVLQDTECGNLKFNSIITNNYSYGQ